MRLGGRRKDFFNCALPSQKWDGLQARGDLIILYDYCIMILQWTWEELALIQSQAWVSAIGGRGDSGDTRREKAV